MKLYNSLTKKIDDFNPKRDEIQIYSCGPTLYKNGHLGNLVSAIYADTLRRTLEFAYPKKTVIQVMNFTDIDDKTVHESKIQYPDRQPMDGLELLTRDVEKEIITDYSAVGIDTEKIKFVRATEHMKQMQNLVVSLLGAGVAYKAKDGIYFSIEKHRKRGREYGQLVQLTTENTSAQRIDNDEYDKDEAHDFALWKAAKKGEPAWDFKLDDKNFRGRPGWHLECSAMSTEYLGQPFDVHTGGVDLKFPHHENEIAQSTAASDHDSLAEFFIHSEHLLIDSKKMAKSENNFYVLRDIIDKGFDPLAFRLFVLQGHYQKQLNFTWEALEASQFRLNSLRNLVELRFQVDQKKSTTREELFAPLLNNMHTPELLARLSIAEDEIASYLRFLDDLLGLNLGDIEDADKKVYELINTRDTTRQSGDFAQSDKIRDQLMAMGYLLKDTDSKTYWQRNY